MRPSQSGLVAQGRLQLAPAQTKNLRRKTGVPPGKQVAPGPWSGLAKSARPVPGGKALEWLPGVIGRSHALEIFHGGADFDADIAERYGWVNRTLDDNGLDSFVDAPVRRLASFDREALRATKAQINRLGMPTAAELQSSNDMFLRTLAWLTAQAHRARLRNIGYGVRSDFQLNFGRYLAEFAPGDDDKTNR